MLISLLSPPLMPLSKIVQRLLYNIGDIDSKYITISEIQDMSCCSRIEKGRAQKTTGLPGKPTGKLLNSLRAINANKYLEVATGDKTNQQ
jgi:hypothetical protein